MDLSVPQNDFHEMVSPRQPECPILRPFNFAGLGHAPQHRMNGRQQIHLPHADPHLHQIIADIGGA
jgi:hypothetical protein